MGSLVERRSGPSVIGAGPSEWLCRFASALVCSWPEPGIVAEENLLGVVKDWTPARSLSGQTCSCPSLDLFVSIFACPSSRSDCCCCCSILCCAACCLEAATLALDCCSATVDSGRPFLLSCSATAAPCLPGVTSFAGSGCSACRVCFRGCCLAPHLFRLLVLPLVDIAGADCEAPAARAPSRRLLAAAGPV